MTSLLYLLLTLAILVVVHEWGHFWVAKRCGVKVLKFSVGFGRPLWSWTGQDGIEYIVAAIPLGGYVKMLDEREGEVDPREIHRAFNRQPLASRMAIVLAGPLANIVFAILAYWCAFTVGIPGIKPVIGEVVAGSPASEAGLRPGDEMTAVNGERTATWGSVHNVLSRALETDHAVRITVNDGAQMTLFIDPDKVENAAVAPLKVIGIVPLRLTVKPVIGQVEPESAASRSGLQVGDRIIAVNGHPIRDWQSLVKIVQANPGKSLSLDIERQGHRRSLTVVPQRQADGTGKLGVAVDSRDLQIPDTWRAVQRYNIVTALQKSVVQTGYFSWITVKSLAGMLVGQVSSKNLGGPITIAQYAGASAHQGVIAFIQFLAMISISLGLLNLLPIPVLDGGHVMMYVIEWFRGAPLSETMQLRLQNMGITLLLMLMVLAFYNDLTRLFG